MQLHSTPLGLINLWWVWRPITTGKRALPTSSLLCCKGGYLNSVCKAFDQWWRSPRFEARPI